MKDNNNIDDSIADKFRKGKSFAQSSELDHAAGDYEPIQDDNHEENSARRELFSRKQNKEIVNVQLNQQERLEVEAIRRENEIEGLRADYGSTDPDRN